MQISLRIRLHWPFPITILHVLGVDTPLTKALRLSAFPRKHDATAPPNTDIFYIWQLDFSTDQLDHHTTSADNATLTPPTQGMLLCLRQRNGPLTDGHSYVLRRPLVMHPNAAGKTVPAKAWYHSETITSKYMYMSSNTGYTQMDCGALSQHNVLHTKTKIIGGHTLHAALPHRA